MCQGGRFAPTLTHYLCSYEQKLGFAQQCGGFAAALLCEQWITPSPILGEGAGGEGAGAVYDK